MIIRIIYHGLDHSNNHDDDFDYNLQNYHDLNVQSSDQLAAKLARKESLSTKLEQRPGRQELIDRNILYQVRPPVHQLSSHSTALADGITTLGIDCC